MVLTNPEGGDLSDYKTEGGKRKRPPPVDKAQQALNLIVHEEDGADLVPGITLKKPGENVEPKGLDIPPDFADRSQTSREVRSSEE